MPISEKQKATEWFENVSDEKASHIFESFIEKKGLWREFSEEYIPQVFENTTEEKE